MGGPYITGRVTALKNIKPQPNIADINGGTIGGAWDGDAQAVVADLQTKVQTLLDQLQALGLQASS